MQDKIKLILSKYILNNKGEIIKPVFTQIQGIDSEYGGQLYRQPNLYITLRRSCRSLVIQKIMIVEKTYRLLEH